MLHEKKSQTLINQNLASEEGDEKLLKTGYNYRPNKSNMSLIILVYRLDGRKIFN
jgi:hypothetical protein